MVGSRADLYYLHYKKNVYPGLSFWVAAEYVMIVNQLRRVDVALNQERCILGFGKTMIAAVFV
jgi:hypothetical protein